VGDKEDGDSLSYFNIQKSNEGFLGVVKVGTRVHLWHAWIW